MNYVKLAFEQDIAIITIDRPETLNALSVDVLHELERALGCIDLDAARCLIITGGGRKAFVAGADISYMSTLTKSQGYDFGKLGSDLFDRIETLRVPVIAAVNGYALGGGCELALSCDIRICSENACFAQPEVGLGITPGYGGTVRLPRVVGVGIAKQMLFTGSMVNAQEALRIGLVSAVHPQDELLEQAMKLAGRIAKNSASAVALTKRAVNIGIEIPAKDALLLENELFASCFGTPDQINGMQAFLNKKK